MPTLTTTHRALASALLAALALTACGGSEGNDPSPQLAIPAPPPGLGYADLAAMAATVAVPAYVDEGATNVRNDPCHLTTATNAGVRVLAGMLDLWTPSSLLVDAGVTLAAANGCPAVTPATWSGLPGDATDGTPRNPAVLDASTSYVVAVTSTRTAEQAAAAYYDDRRGKGYSVVDGLGPLTAAWRAAAQQTTTITFIPADATTVLYSDGGNNTGVADTTANPAFGAVVKFVNDASKDASTEPAKRFYKYARPWRRTGAVVVVPELLPARSGTPASDGGFPSGHTAEAVRDAVAMAYVVPERYQELLARALELGENRILAGMHSPLDVVAGRIQAQAVVAYGLGTMPPALRTAAHAQARAVLAAAVGAPDDAALLDFAHSAGTTTDRFADRAANRREHARRMTFSFTPIADTTRTALVPKGAELLLETRFPYLSAAQRRVVLKTTAYPSGYPLMDDAEGWGRLDLFAAADGYAAFDGDVAVTMDGNGGGFQARDAWRNDISGAGMLTKSGTGTLRLTGHNTYRGGTRLEDGVLQAESPTALGTGDLYVAGGKMVSAAGDALVIGGKLTLRAGGTLGLVLGGGQAGRISVADLATFEGGTLAITFASGHRPAIGDTLNVITGAARQGTFTTVTVEGFGRVTPIYGSTGVQVRIDG